MIFALVKINNVAQFKILFPKSMKEILKRYQIFFSKLSNLMKQNFPNWARYFTIIARRRPGFECDY
jgi:hypothetical protein